MSDEVEALLRGEERQRDRDELEDLIEAARARRAQKGFQLRECLFDRIKVRAVGRQKTEPCADTFDRGLHRWLFMHRQVVEDHDIARPQRRDEHLLDVGEKRGIVDGAIEDRRRRQAIHAEPRDDRVRLPVSARCVVAEPHAPRTPPVAPEEIGRHPRFIDEDVGARVVQGLRVLPPPTRGGDVRPTLLVGVYRFF